MPTSNENFFTRERMMAIGMGISRGFQAHDRKNPLASIGAAMEGSLGVQMGEDLRKQTRAERLADLAAIEEKQKQAEVRAEEGQIRAEARARQNAVNQRADLAAWQKQQREQSKFFAIDQGLKTSGNKDAALKAMREWFASLMAGDQPRYPGSAPIDPYAKVDDETAIGKPMNYGSYQDRRSKAPRRPEPQDESETSLMDIVDPYRREIEAEGGR